MNTWIAIAGVFVAVLGLLFGFAKWFMDWAEKRDAEQEKHVNKRLDDHAAEFHKLHQRIDDHQEELNETREKLIAEYCKHSDITQLRTEIRDDFKSVYQKLGGIDRAVNQLIGIVKGKFTDE